MPLLTVFMRTLRTGVKKYIITDNAPFHRSRLFQGKINNPEGVKYVIPSGFCSVTAYLFYNHINPSDFNCVTPIIITSST